jgi:hypothetical protein
MAAGYECNAGIRSSTRYRRAGWLGIWILVLSTALVVPASTFAQRQRVRSHIYLPPTRGATVLSTYIDAQARYVAAMGDCLESQAIARNLHAEALDKELDNAVKWVETYFERRALNRAYRAKENPGYLDRLKKQQAIKQDKVIQLPDEIRRGDVTQELNWMLNRIADTQLAYEAFFGGDDGALSAQIDCPLSPEDAQHIWLKQAGAKHGQNLPFRAADAEVLDEDWPVVFRAPEFQAARRSFEQARDQALKELQTKKQMQWETFKQLRGALDDLKTQLERKYPNSYRESTMRGQDYVLLYLNGQRFLKGMAASVLRALETNRMESFDQSDAFKGDSLFDLIRHMCHRGLVFSEPKAGDESTYQMLFTTMRHVYSNFQSNDYHSR